MKRFLIIGDRGKYGWMIDFVVLWIGQAKNEKHALYQFKKIISREPHDVYKIIEICNETEFLSYSGF